MTVAELIGKLGGLESDAVVTVRDYFGEFSPLDSVFPDPEDGSVRLGT